MKNQSQSLYTVSMSVFYTILKWAANLYTKYADEFTALQRHLHQRVGR